MSRNFSIKVIFRILNVLAEEGTSNRTNLAVKTSLHYSVCMQYTELLRSLSWIDTVADKKYTKMSITDKGKEVSDALSEYFNVSKQHTPYEPTRTEFIAQSNGHGIQEETLQNGTSLSDIASFDQLIGTNRNNVRKIMLIEDEPDILITFKLSLISAGYKVDSFIDPREALGNLLFHRERDYYDLVITDIRMPYLNGFEIYKKARSHGRKTRFLFLTAIDLADEVFSLLPEFDHVRIIKKPVDQKAFIDAIGLAINSNYTVPAVSSVQ